MTDAISSVGVTLTRATNPIAELTKIGGIELKRDLIDVTNFDSEYREFILGFIDPGEVQIEGNFLAGDTDGQIALKSDLITGDAVAFVITFPASITATWSFNGVVSSFKIGDMVTADKISFSATIKVTGEPTLAITASTGPTGVVVTGNVSGALTLTPTYAADEYEYVADGSAEATVTVTVTDAVADTITVNGSAVTTGVPSSAITLTEDGLTTITVVAKDEGKVPNTYVITIIGPASA